MAGRLLFLILMYSFHEIEAQGLPPPKLTVHPTEITETDSVRLRCEAPSSVSVSQCYFYTVTGKDQKPLSCQETLTGAELLLMSHQSSPAQVEVTCFYVGKWNYASQVSDKTSITVLSLPPPKLTVYPTEIRVTDSVTLRCEAPSSVSVSQCYFYTVTGKDQKPLSCLKTLTGAELLEMSRQSSPAQVEVTCFYVGKWNYASQVSDKTSITVLSLPPPKLTVYPAEITVTDSVRLRCEAPSSVSVSQCYFYTGKTQKHLSCQETLTGAELLFMSHQSSPAQVEVSCYYDGNGNHASPYSDKTSITVLSPKPEMSVHRDDENVLFTCSLPGSVNQNTKCNLYFGEESRPAITTNAWKQRSSKNKQFCQFTVPVEDLLRRLRLVQQKDASCDYSVEREPKSLSPRSDGKNLTYFIEKESHVTRTESTFTEAVNEAISTTSTLATTVSLTSESGNLQRTPTAPQTTGQKVRPRASTSVTPGKETLVSGSAHLTSAVTSAVTSTGHPASPDTETVSQKKSDKTPLNPSSGMLKLIAVVVGMSVGVVVLMLALLGAKRRSEICSYKRTQTNTKGDVQMTNGRVPADNDGAYSLISSEPDAVCAAGSQKLNKQQCLSDDSDVYHVYSTIPDRPQAPAPAAAPQNMMYTLLQAH
ncbi:uncharacterized protein LOC114436842 isoform X2 [Parambassis ranga]|uniref:Uncharacterized protein LOC114436842 isoform X2 n=1 Tax=Parambassis ranga TaxID=210632 RepID=A0A6P7I548_9TELE|nr:uncharacterized protein LOC114436842 isoform X2 [Parambassis ranga]